MWISVDKAYLCKTAFLYHREGNGTDFKSESLGIDSVMMVVGVYPSTVGDKYALLTHTGRIGWAWDTWVKRC